MIAFLPSMIDLSSRPSIWSLSPIRQILSRCRKMSSAASAFMEPDLSSELSALSSFSSGPHPAPSAASVDSVAGTSDPPLRTDNSSSNAQISLSFPPPSSFSGSGVLTGYASLEAGAVSPAGKAGVSTALPSLPIPSPAAASSSGPLPLEDL